MISNLQLSTPYAEGRTADIYLIGYDQILKLYRDWCPTDWIENEIMVARAIHDSGILSPQVGDIVEVKGRHGIMFERIVGISMLQDMNQHPWLIFKYARELAELQCQYQKILITGLPSYSASFRNAIRATPHLSEPLRERALFLLSELQEGQSLCHGDFHPGNIILSPNGPVVIDWMTACLGNPMADAARTYLILDVAAKAARNKLSPVIQLLTGMYKNSYMSHFLKLTQQTGSAVTDWLPVVAAARLNEDIDSERDMLLQIVQTKTQYVQRKL